MPYGRNRGMSKRPIHSVKNILDGVFIGVAAGVTTIVSLATTVNAYTGAAAEVPIGAKVNGIYLFVQIQPQAAQANVDLYVAKWSSGQAGTAPTAGATGGTPQRNKILHEEKGIPGTFNNGAPPLTFRSVIRIPRGMRRFAEGDELKLYLRGATAYDACVKCIYKFYE